MTSLQGLSPLRNAIALVVVAVAFTMPTGAQSTPVVCNGNDTPNNGQTLPCFGNVPDILNGKTTLLPNDDLIVNTNFFDPTTQTFYPAGGNLWTASSAIVKQSSTSITNKNFQVFSNQITIRGRLWAVGHDQILSASVNIDQGGTQAFTSSLEEMDSWISPPSLPSFNKSQNLYCFSGDFLGNGYDQMVVLGVQPGNPGQLVLQALAAADPIVESDGISAGTALPI